MRLMCYVVSWYMLAIGAGSAGAVVVGLWSAFSGRPHPRGLAEFCILILIPAVASAVYLHGAYSVGKIGRGRQGRPSISIALASAASLTVAISGIVESLCERANVVHPLWFYLVCWGALSAFAVGGFVISFGTNGDRSARD
jgi:hypothetical protein